MSLKAFVNTPKYWDEYVDYIDRSLQAKYNSLSHAVEPHDIYRIQGQIKNLREMKQLKDTLNAKQYG